MNNIEKEIRNLENEIAKLKSKNALQSRLEHIKNKANERDTAIRNEIENLTFEYAELKIDVDCLADRILNIVEIARELKRNKFEFSTELLGLSSEKIKFFKHDYVYYGKFTLGIGSSANMNNPWVFIELFFNDETMEEDINVRTTYADTIEKNIYFSDEKKIEILKQSITALTRFLADFDNFEKRFYDLQTVYKIEKEI